MNVVKIAYKTITFKAKS